MPYDKFEWKKGIDGSIYASEFPNNNRNDNVKEKMNDQNSGNRGKGGGGGGGGGFDRDRDRDRERKLPPPWIRFRKSDGKIWEKVINLRRGHKRSAVWYCPNFLEYKEAQDLFHTLMGRKAEFSRDFYFKNGHKIPTPRFVASYADEDISYTYSGNIRGGKPWLPCLRKLRDRISPYCSHKLNFALCNLYEDGQHSIGWHADNEEDIIQSSTIASISLGATRTFQFKDFEQYADEPTTNLRLAHGSLVLMEQETQHLFKHRVPKESQVEETRINITLRSILPPQSSR